MISNKKRKIEEEEDQDNALNEPVEGSKDAHNPGAHKTADSAKNIVSPSALESTEQKEKVLDVNNTGIK